MRRREFIISYRRQLPPRGRSSRGRRQPAIPVVGFLSSRSPSESAEVIMSFRQGLQEKGFVEGQNVVIAFRWAEGAYNRLPSLADELVAYEWPHSSRRASMPQHSPPKQQLLTFQ